MKIGFTGTQQGLLVPQRRALVLVLLRLHKRSGITEAHHGDCVGGDAEFHEIIVVEVDEAIKIHIHPPMDPKKRAFIPDADVYHDPRPYLIRNEDIVLDTEALVACPPGFKEVLRSGTWATVRRAKKHHRPTILVWPNGVVTRRYHAG